MSDAETAAVSRERFQEAYAGKAPWDVGRPQPAFVAVADSIRGSILDAGCGPGDNALFFAARGHEVTGIDFLETPVAAARRKAEERGLRATFLVTDVLQLKDWVERFDNVIDSGLFHVFSDEGRVLYVRTLETVLKPGGRLLLLCFSDKTPGNVGPRRVRVEELRAAFANGWHIESIEPVSFEVRAEQKPLFADENPKAWFLIARRAR